MEDQELSQSNNDNLASRWSRLWAALIDAGLAMAITIPLMSYLNIWDAVKQGAIPLDATIKLAVIGWVMFFVMHGYLLKNYGQTIGKKVLGISIVTLNGGKPDFWPLIIKRYLPLALIPHIPLAGRLLPTIDALFVFRKDKRCVHDLIAGTMVVNSCVNKSNQQDAQTARASV